MYYKNRNQKWAVGKKLLQDVFQDTPQNRGSGIYLYWRKDELGISYFYVGQALDLYSRQIDHVTGHAQHIDNSLHSRKFRNANNPYGWEFQVLEYLSCDKKLLNEREQYWIMHYLKKGWQTYNETYGSQGEGKTLTRGGKQVKGYYDGVEQGKKTLAKKMREYVHRLSIAPNSTKKLDLNAYEKFMYLLYYGDEEDETRDTKTNE